MGSKRIKTHKITGFSLVEILISLGILSTISLGVAYNMANLYKNQAAVTSKSETKNFTGNLRSYLSSIEFCENELIGQTFPMNSERDLTVNQMISLGSATTLSPNTRITEGVRINELKLQHKAGVASQTVFDGTNNLTLVSGRVSIAMQNKHTDKANEWVDLKPTTIDVPLLLNPTTNVIESCGLSASLDPQIACAAVGSDYDAVSGECEPLDTCTMRGTYTTWNCTPSYSSCGSGVTSHVNRIGANLVTRSWGQRVYTGTNGGGIVNPVTNSLSCPTGSVPEVTGSRTSSYNVSTGKKSSQTISEETTFITCMECN